MRDWRSRKHLRRPAALPPPPLLLLLLRRRWLVVRTLLLVDLQVVDKLLLLSLSLSLHRRHLHSNRRQLMIHLDQLRPSVCPQID